MVLVEEQESIIDVPSEDTGELPSRFAFVCLRPPIICCLAECLSECLSESTLLFLVLWRWLELVIIIEESEFGV